MLELKTRELVGALLPGASGSKPRQCPEDSCCDHTLREWKAGGLLRVTGGEDPAGLENPLAAVELAQVLKAPFSSETCLIVSYWHKVGSCGESGK